MIGPVTGEVDVSATKGDDDISVWLGEVAGCRMDCAGRGAGGTLLDVF